MQLTYKADWVDIGNSRSTLQIGIYLAVVRPVDDGSFFWDVDDGGGDGYEVASGSATGRYAAKKAAQDAIRKHHAGQAS
jgi:hypothetical protein